MQKDSPAQSVGDRHADPEPKKTRISTNPIRFDRLCGLPRDDDPNGEYHSANRPVPVTALLMFLQFGAGLALLLAALEFVKKDNRQFAPALALLYLSLAVLIARIWFIAAGLNLPLSRLILFHASLSLLSGPLLLLQAQNMRKFLGEAQERLSRWHFFPVGLAVIADVVAQYMPESRLQNLLLWPVMGDALTLFRLFVMALFLHFLAYFVVVLAKLRSMHAQYALDGFPTIVAALLTPAAGASLAIIGFQSGVSFLLLGGGFLLALTPVIILALSLRNPQFLTALKRQIQRQKYERTRLENVDLGAVSARLDVLMKEEKLFLDENLSLDSLARSLLISRHQLSRILNEIHSKSFRDYVNHFRIEEAKRRLCRPGDLTIMRVAFDVGFNNKATFNAQFSRLTGMTPLEYRRSHVAAG